MKTLFSNKTKHLDSTMVEVELQIPDVLHSK